MVSLDSLLGRKELKERVSELEEVKESLERRLEKTDDRRREAERGKQEAYEERNRLETKVEELRDRLERAEKSGGSAADAVDVSDVQPTEVSDVVDLISSVEGAAEHLTTAYVSPGDGLPEALPDRVHAALSDVDSSTGLAVYVDDHHVTDVCLLPLRPVRETHVEHGSAFTVDRDLFRLPGSYVAAVVRSDAFAAGLYRDGELREHAAVTSKVKSGHSKGGFSQKRFERLRDEQIQEHLDDSADALSELVESTGVDAVYLLGARDLTGRLADSVDLDVDARQTTDARSEGEQLLQDAVHDLRSSRIYRL